MKRTASLLVLLFTFFCTFAETINVHIENPDTWTSADLRPYVGETVCFDVPFYVCNNYYITRSELTISPRRIYSPTNQAIPASTEYYSIISANNSGTVTLTDQTTYRRMGEKILNLTAYVQSTTTLVPSGGQSFYGNDRTAMQKHEDIGDYNLKVCGFNLEYYLVDNLGTGYGPDNAAESAKQHEKILKALLAIDADIYGLVEIEQGQAALKKLADALNQAKGTTSYTFINDGGMANGSYTKAGILYNSAKVTPYGNLQSDETGVRNRKKAQAFILKENQEKFVLSINHFKAKSGSASGSDSDQGDGQGSYNYTRTNEAKAVVQMLNNNKNYWGDTDFLVMGDLNAYAKEDPIRVFTDAGYYDLHRAFHNDSSYSYTYREQAGYLDHALASPSMYMQVTGMTAYHINSDEHDKYTYNGSWNDGTMFRCSDHDPIIVGLSLGTTNHALLPFDERASINTAEFANGQSPLTISNAENAYLYVYSIYGNTMLAQVHIDTPTYTINTTNWPAGVYIVQLFGDGSVKQAKIIKSR